MSDRELEFRAWNDVAKRYSHTFGLGQSNIIYTDDDDNIVRTSLNNEKIEQYTCLKDNNGTKIFEGDIVDKKFKVQVLFFHGGWYVVGKYPKKRPLFEWLLLRIKAGVPSEVIGNIRENPELLK